jgi:hypothetical protein
MAGGDDLQSLVAGVQPDERQYLLEDNVAQQVPAIGQQFTLLFQFIFLSLFRGDAAEALFKLAQLQDKKGQPQEFKASDLIIIL